MLYEHSLRFEAEQDITVSDISKITVKTIPVLTKHYLSQSQEVADKEYEMAWEAHR
jgi:hypothetical protein